MDTLPISPALCQTYQPGASIRWADWTMEPKLDGYRVVARVGRGTVRLYARSGADLTGRLPHVEASLREWADQHADGQFSVLDCEAVYLDPDTGLADFLWTAAVMKSKPAVAAAKQRASGRWLTLMAFDAPYLLGVDLTGQPIEVRRQALATICAAGFTGLQAIPHGTASPERHAEYCARGEGSVLKRRGSAYPRGRSADWLKWKMAAEADVVILGFTPGTGKYADTVGAIRFGQYRDGDLVERGQCSGMTDAQRRDMGRHPERYLGRTMAISHNGVLVGGEAYRHPQYRGVRDDKAPQECMWEAA
ncbi:MAG TPA: hypothetical protein VH208_04605 [Myxococcaceae bacterium]|jgi:bifunctional non-homologous end joining protein LigD|nr:hypothetical protein [Myxococcaceae bacterium]